MERDKSGLPDIQTTDASVLHNFNRSEARIMEDGFMSSAILPRRLGGHNLAMPSWTIVPMLYHKPPDYNMRRTVRPVDLDDKSEDRELFQEDDYGTVWKIKSRERSEHKYAMDWVQKHAAEGLSDMKSVEYHKAVTKFDKALSMLWPCHRGMPLECWIKIHRGHALLRAGLLQCPAIHGKKTSELIQMSFEMFYECVGTLRIPQNVVVAAIAFNRSLLFSGLLGLAWIFFFRGNMEKAEGYICEAQNVHLEPTHMRSYLKPAERSLLRSPLAWRMKPPVDIDTFFFRVALRRVIGSLNDIQSLFDRLGNELSKYDEDSTLSKLLEKQLADMKGDFAASVSISAHHSFKLEGTGPRYYDDTKPVVANFLDQLEAGYSGNMWFAVGANQQARSAYECVLASDSVLLRAAALVGLGNVFMRLSEAFSSVGNEETGVRSCTKADKVELGFSEAEKKYNEALEIYDELGFKEGQVIVQCNLGNLCHKRGQLQQALERYTLVKTYLSEKMARGLAALHLDLKVAELHLDMGDWEDLAFNSIRVAAQIHTITNNPLAMAWVEHLSGSYYMKKAMATEGCKEEQLGNLASAKTHLQDAIKFFAGIQVSVGVHTSVRLTIFEQQKETYALLLWCIACCQPDNARGSTRFAIEALVWCERSRSRVSMAENWDYFYPSISKYLAEPEAILEALKATASVDDSVPYKESWKHLQVMLSRCKQLAATVVMEYVLCADFGFLIFVLDLSEQKPKMERVSFKEQELNGEKLDREKLTALVDRTVYLLDPKSTGEEEDQELEANLAFLYKLLIKPVEEWLKKTQQIIVNPHEVLFRIPFHALIDGEKRYLIQSYKLSYEESIRSLLQSSLLWERNAHSRRVQDNHHDSVVSDCQARNTWLVVGINKHRPNAADLEFAEREAEEVDKLLGKEFTRSEQSRVFIGSEATKKQVKASFEKVDIIHLATHGIINAKYERGGILFATPAAIRSSEKFTDVVDFESHSATETFKTITRSVVAYHEVVYEYRKAHSQKSKPSDEVVLSASEISDMQLEAQLVVLSACQSANGVVLGEGVAGLGRALMQAGVPCRVLSLWPVSDKGTIVFMTKFYGGLTRGRPLADAMKATMETMINEENKYNPGKRKYNVRHWAAFVAYGFPNVRVAHPAPPAKEAQRRTDDKRPQMQSSGVLQKIGRFALAQYSRITDVTRSTMSTEAPEPYAWNPIPIEPHRPMKPTFRGLVSLPPAKRMVIFARHFAFYLIYLHWWTRGGLVQ